MNLSQTNQVIGVAGCGAMGLPMAKALQKAGFAVWGFDVRPPEEFLDFEGQMVAEPGEFSRRCDLMISVVRDEKQTHDLLFEDQALFSYEGAPKTVILSSTLPPRVVGEVRAKLPDSTILIDAPMSGAPVAAQQASLTFMLGGAEKHITPLQPIFKAMGKTVHHLGELGAGMTFKVLNNFLAATSTVAVRRILEEAPKLGLSQDKLLEVMSASSGATWFGDNFHDIAWAKEGYAPENTMGILEKDMAAFLNAIGDGPSLFDEAVLEGLRKMKPFE